MWNSKNTKETGIILTSRKFTPYGIYQWFKIKNFADTNYNNFHFRHFLITTRLTRLDFIIIILKAGRDQEEDPIKITEEEKTEMATNDKGKAVDREVISQNSKAI